MTSPTHRDTLDDQIDRVASRLTESKLSADFRERVLARLDQRQPRSFGGWTLAAAAAMAIVVIGAGVSMWPKPASTPQVVTAQVRSTAPVLTATPTSEATPATTVDRARVAQTDARPAAPTFVSSVPALDPIDPLEVITQESIQPAKLSIAQLKVNAIVMPAVDDDGSNQ
jgi:hypothetical protein